MQEPITFAPAAKPQFMKLLFQALADATKAAAAAAAEQQQRGGRAARNRRSSKHQQKQMQEAAAAAAGQDAGDAAGGLSMQLSHALMIYVVRQFQAICSVSPGLPADSVHHGVAAV